MTVVETQMEEDPKNGTVVTTENFHCHGKAILDCLPEDARLPMMKIALMYQEELDSDPFLFGDAADLDDYDEDDEDGEEAGSSRTR